MTVSGTNGHPGVPAPSHVVGVFKPKAGQNESKRRMVEKNVQELEMTRDFVKQKIAQVWHIKYLHFA